MSEGLRLVLSAFAIAAATVICLHVVFRNKAVVLVEKVIPKTPSILSFASLDTNYNENYKELKARPNVLLVIVDDLGYGDLESYGHPERKRSFVDELAASGIRFQSVYAADSLCSPSRAGLLTGRLPIRTGIISHNGGFRVMVPQDKGGLQPHEVTIPEVLKTVGYETGMVGKWHLGINAKNSTDGTYLPGQQGFDFVGVNLPMTNNKRCDESKVYMHKGPAVLECFLYNGSKIVQQPINFTHLTDDLVSDFNRFMDQRTKDKPFFFYFSFPQVHTALFSWKSKFAELSHSGLFGGDILEMSDAVRQLVDRLKADKIDKDTLILFMSDHGPHVEICSQGGTTPFKGGKATSFEGGYRIPFFLSWPSVVPPRGVSQSVLSMLDILPTLAAMTGAELPQSQLDGTDQREFFLDATKTKGHRPIFYYCNDMLMAIRYGPYKLHYRIIPPPDESDFGVCPNGIPIKEMYHGNAMVCSYNDTRVQHPPLVYHILKDPGERWPLEYDSLPPTLRENVEALLESHRQSLVNDITPPQVATMFDLGVTPCCNPPFCKCDYEGDSVYFLPHRGNSVDDD